MPSCENTSRRGMNPNKERDEVGVREVSREDGRHRDVAAFAPSCIGHAHRLWAIGRVRPRHVAGRQPAKRLAIEHLTPRHVNTPHRELVEGTDGTIVSLKGELLELGDGCVAWAFKGDRRVRSAAVEGRERR